VLGLTVSGIAVAAKKPARKQVAGCYHKKTGAFRMVTRGRGCKRGERKVVWSKSGVRGPRGPRGARGTSGGRGSTGAVGAVGPRGATGPAGATGPRGPSDSLEVFNNAQVSITGVDGSSANSLATLSNAPTGSYLVTARVQLNGPTTTESQIFCTASLGARSVSAISNVGTSAGNVIHDVVMLTFNVSLSSPGTANLKCHRESLTGTAATASQAFLELLKVDSATSEPVTS
jgi:hypothetical protein